MRGVVLLTASLAAAAAAAGDGLPEGAYRVAVHLAIRNVETHDYDFETEICWRGAGDPQMPLGPLGPGPLARCPSQVQDTPQGATVTTICEGPNAGFAVALYRRTAEGFTGRVEVNLGGKNMTLAEMQRGTRTGDCK